MDLETRLEQERAFHDAEADLRNHNTLITGVYSSGLFDEAVEYMLGAAGEVRDLSVLDFGCGAGAITQHVQERGAAVIGLDISLSRLVDARADARAPASAHEPAGFVLGPGEALPFADHTFDVVLGKQILHHLDLELAASEVARVLKPLGKAIFLEPLIHNPVLQTYRRWTPHLRSASEKALSMGDVATIQRHFSRLEHREFCFLAIVPAVVEAALHRRGALAAPIRWLRTVDRALLRIHPGLGRYYWETVLVLQK
jgi:ubiquinone/menaquinone biosynthesis C-methylase UbiE